MIARFDPRCSGNPIAAVGATRCEGRGGSGVARAGWLAVLWFLVIAVPGAGAQVAPPASPPDLVFAGTCPPVLGSSAALILPADFRTGRSFRWMSSDTVVGEVDTRGFVNATQWTVVGNRPARLVFRGSAGGVVFSGEVLLDPPNRAVVDLVRGGKRIRYLLVPLVVDLDGDGNHDGVVEDTADDDDPENVLPGLITLCNLDDDDEDGVRDNEGADAATIDDGLGGLDSDDLAPLVVRAMPGLPDGWSVELRLRGPGNLEAGRGLGAGDVVRVFADPAGGNPTAILGPGATGFVLPAAAAHGVDLAHLRVGDLVNLGFEGLEFAGEVKLVLEVLNAGGVVVASDEVQLKVSPLLLLGHDRDPSRSFVSRINLPAALAAESTAYCGTRFAGATPLAAAADHVVPPALNGGNDPWAQDEFQIGFQMAPYAAWHVVLDSKRDRGLDAFPGRAAGLGGLLGPDFGHFVVSDGTAANSLDSFGNLEVTPPCRVGTRNFPFGRIYYGDNAAGRRMDRRLRDFWLRQRITGQDPLQDPVTFNSDWLAVGHVDEFMSIVMDAGATQGWRVVLADPRLGIELLAGGGGHPGVDANLHTPRYRDFDLVGTVVDRASALPGRPLNAPVPAGSATIEDYNLNEMDDLLFGTPAAGHTGGMRAEIRAAFGLANADFVLTPVLFNRVAGGKSVAITPGLANGAVYPGVYVAPDNFLHNHTIAAAAEEDANANFRLDAGEDADGNGLLDTRRDPFHVHFDASLPGGVVATYIDDWEVYHLGDGEVHCSSNETRDLPPRVWWP